MQSILHWNRGLEVARFPLSGNGTDNLRVRMDYNRQQPGLAPGSKFSRRALLAGVVATACSRKRASRYHGWLFVSSGAGKSVAVADLAFFRRVTDIPLGVAPDQLFH